MFQVFVLIFQLRDISVG